MRQKYCLWNRIFLNHGSITDISKNVWLWIPPQVLERFVCQSHSEILPFGKQIPLFFVVLSNNPISNLHGVKLCIAAFKESGAHRHMSQVHSTTLVRSPVEFCNVVGKNFYCYFSAISATFPPTFLSAINFFYSYFWAFLRNFPLSGNSACDVN